MSKWYRISLSLATKCRIGFALAVLIVVSAGLIIPYRWMDKLIEQGKQELAQAEVNHMYQRHFKPVNEPDVSPSELEIPLPEDYTSQRPETSWVRLNQLDLTEDSTSVRVQLEKLYPNDQFLRHGIVRFTQKDNPRTEMFALQTPEPKTPSEQDKAESEESTIIDWFGAILPANLPARYLKPVHADSTCISSGCHMSRLAEATMAETEKPINAPPAFSEGELVGVVSVLIPAGQTSLTMLANRLAIVVGGLISCICAIVTFYLITQRFILEPVRSLRIAADQVTLEAIEPEDSNDPATNSWKKALDLTAEIKTGDEYEKLALAFHQMLSRLKTAHDRLRETNKALDTRLGEVEAKNVALFEANKLKSEFLANVSHELRTPLNAIIGFAELLNEQAKGREDQKSIRYTNNVLESGKLLLRIINELLDLAKIEAGKLQIHWEKCAVASLVNDLVSFTTPLSEKKSITITVDATDEIPLIETDPERLQQIIFNLLDNAIKFTPENGHIDIAVNLLDSSNLSLESLTAEDILAMDSVNPDKNGQFVRIAISDTGPGIPQEDREVVFDKFRQLDGSVTRTHTGTGLGLAIVKELTQILGATISISDNQPQGTTFTVTMPIDKPSKS